MTPQEARDALESLVAKGFMVKLPDGKYAPTELGRLVAKASGGKN